ncbi:MAG: hypothetical protein ABFC31_10900 [Clostridiaceae bacterium]
MKNARTIIYKHAMLVIVLVLTFAFIGGCGTKLDNSAKARILIDSSNIDVLVQEVERAEASYIAPDKETVTLENPTYHIIIDGNLGAQTSWGSKEAGDYSTGNGFLDKKCTTYDSLTLLLSEITSGEKTFGYFSCERGEANPVSDTELADGVCKANYFSYDSAFHSDLNNTKNFKSQKSIANLISEIAASAARQTESNNVFILLSDLAMQNESQSNQIADALAKYVIDNDKLTMSLVGVEADYVGKINNVPRTSIGIEPKRVFGVSYNSSKVFQRYIYLLIIGEPEQVYETTQQIVEKCENNRNLSRGGQVKSLYFSSLECAPCSEGNLVGLTSSMTQEEVEPELTFCGNIAAYGTTEYKTKFVFDMTKIEEDDCATVSKIPLASIYEEAAAQDGENIHVECQFPFVIWHDYTLTNLDTSGDDALTYTFAQNNPEVSITDIKKLDLETVNEFSANIAGWTTCDSKTFKQAVEPVFDQVSGKIQMGFVVYPAALQDDLPLVLSVTIQPEFMPDRAKLLESYAADWLVDWSMDIKTYNQEWDDHAFLFTQATKTAYLAETFLYNLLDRQIDKNIDDVTEEMSSYEKTFLFGVVKHDKASKYVDTAETTDNLGWAFSQYQVENFPNQ